MTEGEARRQLCDLGRHLYERGLLAGRAGNLSLRRPGGLALATPRGAHKARMEPRALVRLSIEEPEPEALARATTEWPLHREALRARPDVGAVLHAHAPALTAAGLARVELGEALPEVEDAVGRIASVAFAPSGSEALGRAVGEAVGAGAFLVLMERHGVVAVGATVEDGLDRLELAELSARAVLLARGGQEPPSPR